MLLHIAVYGIDVRAQLMYVMFMKNFHTKLTVADQIFRFFFVRCFVKY